VPVLLASIGALLVIITSDVHSVAKTPSARAVSGLAAVNGTRLHYETRGRGPAVVLIHGGLVDSRLWDDQMTPLSQKFRIVRYDLRGHGRSETPSGTFSHGAREVVVAGASHHPPVETPGAFNRLLLDFLR
jgi:pimeloyl-ACP methyl ester carboxylesterase